jgi:hypothetical protein
LELVDGFAVKISVEIMDDFEGLKSSGVDG